MKIIKWLLETFSPYHNEVWSREKARQEFAKKQMIDTPYGDFTEEQLKKKGIKILWTNKNYSTNAINTPFA